MKRLTTIFLCLFLSFALHSQAQSLKDLGLRKAKDRLKGLIDEKKPEDKSTSESNESSNEGNSKTLNKRMSKDEVMQTLDDARAAYNGKNYSEARYTVQQALVEIETQLGEKVLAAMPKEILSQSYDPESDVALSTGVGFIGLEISRDYPGNNGNISAIIANNSIIMGPYAMALSNPQMISQNENMKSVTVSGKRGVIELDGDSYKIAIPFGQSSVFLFDCEACQNESEAIKAAEVFQLDAYLKILGESPLPTDNK